MSEYYKIEIAIGACSICGQYQNMIGGKRGLNSVKTPFETFLICDKHISNSEFNFEKSVYSQVIFLLQKRLYEVSKK